MFESKNFKTPEPQWKKSISVQRDEANLRSVLNKTVQRDASKERKPRTDLIPNFHWIIMRARRHKKVTQEQLALEISEPLIAIKRAEMGIIPEGEYNLVTKLENFFGINLIKEGAEIKKPEQTIAPKTPLDLTKADASAVTIADLKKIQTEEISKDLWDYTEYLKEKEKKKGLFR